MKHSEKARLSKKKEENELIQEYRIFYYTKRPGDWDKIWFTLLSDEECPYKKHEIPEGFRHMDRKMQLSVMRIELDFFKSGKTII